MSQSTSVSPARVGLYGAVVGAGIGYAVAPRQFNLEDLIIQKDDVFQRTFSEHSMQFASESQKQSVKSIQTARDSFTKAAKAGIEDGELAKLLKNKTLSEDYVNIKKLLPKTKTYAAAAGAILVGLTAMLAKIIFTPKDK